MSVRERLRRPDWLRELQAVLIVGLIVVGGLGIVGVGFTAALGDRLSLELPASAVSATVDYGLRDGATVAADQEVTVTVTEPSLPQRLAWALATLPTGAVVATLLVLLLRLVWRARRKDPIALTTVSRLRVLGVVALAGGYLAFIVELLGAMALSGTVTTRGVGGGADFPMSWFLIGFGLFAVAEVVKRAYAMRVELETVV